MLVHFEAVICRLQKPMSFYIPDTLKSGHSSPCMSFISPVFADCIHEGRVYGPGENFHPSNDPCQICTCEVETFVFISDLIECAGIECVVCMC